MSERYRQAIAKNFKNGIIAGIIIMPIMYLIMWISENWERIIEFFE